MKTMIENEKINLMTKAKKALCFFLAMMLILVPSFFVKGLSKEVYATEKLKPIYKVDRADNKISISFDAAWGADKTRDILDVLEEYDVKCTFFLVSFWAEKYPDLAREIILRGHEVGTHSSTHPHFNSMTHDQKSLELADSVMRISTITREKITLFRPPFGEYDNDLIRVANGLNLDVIQWDVDSLDWKNLSANEIFSRVTKKVESGSIILCHNNAKNIVEGIKMILPELQKRGFQFVKISELIHKKPYSVDINGVQHAN